MEKSEEAEEKSKAWGATGAEREFQRFVQAKGYENALNGLRRGPGGSVSVVVARPTHATYEWLARIDGDIYPATSKYSRDIHLSADAEGILVQFCGARDSIVALRHEERKLKRGGRFAASPMADMEDVPVAFRAQAVSIARKAWELLPAEEASPPRVRFMPSSQQLEVVVACFPDALLTYADLHQFVHATCARSAWCESARGTVPLLIVGARVPVTLAEERGRDREHEAGGSKRMRS